VQPSATPDSGIASPPAGEAIPPGVISAVALTGEGADSPTLLPQPIERHAVDILERIPVGVLVSRAERILYANRTLLDYLDYDSIAAIEANGGLRDLFKSRSPQTATEFAAAAPLLLRARDGETLPVDGRIQAVDWDGQRASLMTVRRAAEAELAQKLRTAELELRMREADLRETRAILDTATDGAVVLDDRGRILSLNRAAEALFGYDQKEVAGELFTVLLAPESHAPAIDYLEGLKSGGVRSVLNDGREVIGRVRQGGPQPLFMALGQIGEPPMSKYCAVLRDLAPWKRAEAELVSARKAAERASSQKSEFLAKISHEIRTPLSAIIGFAEVMIEERFGAVGNARYKDYLKDIHGSGQHVISLVNDLLDLSKIEAGKLELDFTSVDVNDVVSSCVSLLQPQAQQGRIVVRTSLSRRVPLVVADLRSLKQIVLNILSNAIKFTDPGGQLIVSTNLGDSGEVNIRVRDTGIGMSEKEVEQALEPFRQLHTARRSGGTGLGLPLTKALAEANRATFRITSTKGEGTLVEVIFPATRVLAE
jgi:PAS domain S-box-containing protein